MNINGLLNMIMRMFVRKAVGRGMDMGFDRMAGKGKPRDQMSKEDRRLAQQGKRGARNAPQVAKISRRIGRM